MYKYISKEQAWGDSNKEKLLRQQKGENVVSQKVTHSHVYD